MQNGGTPFQGTSKVGLHPTPQGRTSKNTSYLDPHEKFKIDVLLDNFEKLFKKLYKLVQLSKEIECKMSIYPSRVQPQNRKSVGSENQKTPDF